MFRWIFFGGFIALVFILKSCSSPQRLTADPDQAFAQKQYALASTLYEERFDRNPNASDVAFTAYNLAISLERSNQHKRAADWYKVSYDKGYGPLALRSQAFALKKNESYAEAISVFEELVDLTVDNKSYKDQIYICQKAIEWKAAEPSYQVDILPMCKDRNEFAIGNLGDATWVVSADDVEGLSAEENYWWTGSGYSRLWIWDTFTDQLSPFFRTYNQNSRYNEGNFAIHPDGAFGVFVRCESSEGEDGYCHLYECFPTADGQWRRGDKLSFVEEKANYSHPCFAPNGTILLFASDKAGGQGGFDLYTSELRPDGEYSAPVALPDIINTELDENSPFVYEDSLYFSSDGHLGMGGKDVFRTYINSEGQWQRPTNLQSPINSGADDFGYTVQGRGRGFLASNRSQFQRGDNLYAWRRTDLPVIPDLLGPEDDSSSIVALPELSYQIKVNVLAKEYLDRKDAGSSSGEYIPLKNARVIISQPQNEQEMITDPLGSVIYKSTDVENRCEIVVSKKGFFSNSIAFNPANFDIQDGDTYNLTVKLDRIFVGEEIVLQDIYYDLDKWDIREDARPTLDSLALVLELNPDISIELGSHTDCRGGDEYNLDLSQKRAQSAVDYLADRGVSISRLTAKGYGETAFRVDCMCESCTEEEHQQNRRTTFRVTQ